MVDDLSLDPELLKSFLDESEESLASVAPLVLRLETAPVDVQAVEAIFRPVHSLKGNAAFFNLMGVKALAHALEDVLDRLRKGRMGADRALADLLLAAVDGLQAMLARVRAGGGEDAATVEGVRRALVDAATQAGAGGWGELPRRLAALDADPSPANLAALRTLLGALAPAGTFATAPAASAAPAPTPAPAPAAPAPAPADAGERTLRVGESHIDTFLAYVGDLLVVGDMFKHLQRRLDAGEPSAAVAGDVRRATNTFATLSHNLQRSIMAIRRLPVAPLLAKAPRLARDVARLKNKEITVHLSGEDLLVDKSHLDLLDAPLVHLVRNAADHGIEPPAVRTAAGKPVQGAIRVSVIENDAWVELTVADDGGGIDLDAVRGKAEAMGLVQPGQPLGEAELVEFIFASGVSTAAEVSDVSGRGVGLDVVKRAIESAGGSVGIATVRGEGTTFRIQLPKNATTQILTGFLVGLGGARYIIPLEHVREAMTVESGAVRTVLGKGRCIERHGAVLPLVDLHRRLGHEATVRADARLVVVAVEASRRPLGLAVDTVLGVQQVVLRDIPDTAGGDAIAGAALMGDGTLALVLDVDRLVQA